MTKRIKMFLFISILETLLIITGLFSLQKNRPVFLYFLLIIITIDFVNENFIVTHCMQWWRLPSNLFYNLYSLLEILGWMLIYYNIFKTAFIKHSVNIIFPVILIYSLFEIFIIDTPNKFHTVSYALFSFASLFYSALYFFKINSKPYHNISQDPAFWMCAGVIFYQSLFLVNLITVLDAGYWKHENALQVFHVLQSIAQIMYYLFLCICFITSYYRYHKVITRTS